MKTFDFTKVAQEAARSGQASDDKKEYRYKIVYPGQGKLKFRILFNPKSGLVGRLITRHNIEGKKILCASTYSRRDDCPICKALSDIENFGKSYPREYKPTTRGLFYAQFVSADYEVASGDLKKGDIFLLMVPYTIYKKINKWISDFSQDSIVMSKVFGSHQYFAQVIERGSEATDWDFRPDPNIEIESAPNDDEFAKMIEDIDNLYEAMGFHEKITPEEVALMRTTAADLVTSFISSDSAPKGYTPPVPPVEDKMVKVNPTAISQAPQQVVAPVAPRPEVTSPVSTPLEQVTHAAPVSDDTKPRCWGNYVDQANDDPSRKSDKIRCKYCPVSTECRASSTVPF